MTVVKSRKQGNAIMVTIPRDLNIAEGVSFEPEVVDDGILYRFVNPQEDEMNFDREILTDIISEGFEGQDIVIEFEKRKKKVPLAFERLAREASQNPAMTREELSKEIGL